MAGRIDVHHHFLSPAYLQVLDKVGGDPSGFPTPAWSIDADQKLCNECDIDTAILSVTAPGPGILKGPEASQLARECNKEEIRYAFYELQTDGVTLFTRYGYGNYYLGHPDIRPIWEELHRRSAVVFIRPTHAVETNLVNKMLPQPFIDYPHETTRTAVDLIATDTIRKYSNCKVILSHAGDTLRYLAVRPAVAGNGCGLWKIPIFIVPTYILYTKSREYRTHQHPRSEAVRTPHWLPLALFRAHSLI
ncbi:hypothetical protein VI817_002354 [Penicillium citrinum]|nr:hypothetical protein VI817_002354 [Penicillium citrinum]